MTKDKEAKFFCEYCDTEVPRNARFCPKCGHFFLSVRCPMCGLTGDQDDFTDGCPACGYAFGGNKKEQVEKRAANHNEVHDSRKSNKREDALPLWVYFAAIGALTVLLFVFFSKM